MNKIRDHSIRLFDGRKRTKSKTDTRKNPDIVDTSMGKKYLKMGRVVILESRFYDNSNK